jgi:adenine deaminase
MTIEANLVDIMGREVYPVRVETEAGRIASITRIDTTVSGYILPGFIDAHIHIESSMLVPSEFARLAVRHGTVATVSDPHEIANVMGLEGVEFMISNANASPFRFHFGASPCVPATPFETSGAALDAEAVAALLRRPEICCLSEVMNVPGVLGDDAALLQMIEAAKREGKRIDGHAPGLRGGELDRYIAAGITTDHEAFTYEEAKEKLEKGMKIIIREGSAAKNFDALEPLIDTWHAQMMFCSDDRHPDDLLSEHINAMAARAVARGHDRFKVLQMACINPIEHYGLDVGRLRVGDRADFIVVEDLEDFRVLRTVIGGVSVFENGSTLLPSVPVTPVNNFHALPLKAEELAFSAACKSVEVIGAIDHELVTTEQTAHLPDAEGAYRCDLEKDILKIVVYNRYRPGKPAVAFVNGFGLKSGAIASSIAHDSHNIIAVGTNDGDIAEAINRIVASRGGVCAVGGGEAHTLPLEVAGIMSAGDGFEVAKKYAAIDRDARERLGSPLSAPFMTLSFMALLVIPEIKLSDKGLFDGRRFRFIDACRR